MICSLYCTVAGCHAMRSFLTSLRTYSANSPEATPLFILQRHNTTIQMHLNINADTNNKCTKKDFNIPTEYMFAWNINSWSVIHRPVFLFIHSLYNQADVWRADHNPVYEKRVREKTKVGSQTWYTTMYITHGSLLPPTVLTIDRMHYAGISSKKLQYCHLDKKGCSLNIFLQPKVWSMISLCANVSAPLACVHKIQRICIFTIVLGFTHLLVWCLFC